MQRRVAVGALCTMALALTAATQNQQLNVKLGLWQMTYKYKTNNASTIAPELLARMTPQKRARMKAKLKARAAQGPRIDTKQVCVTQKKLDSAAFTLEDRKSCERTVISSTSTLQEFREECNDKGMRTVIEARIEAADASDIRGSIQVKGSRSYGTGTSTELSGRWLAADCAVKKDD
jgi:hypothetical protein